MTPDGMPMVWAGQRAGAADMTRVYGPDLMLALAERAAAHGWRSFFYGGKDGVPDQLVATAAGALSRLRRRSGTLLAAVPAADAGGGRRDRRRDQRVRCRHRLGRAEHAEAGALDGRARRPAEGAGAARRRRRVRLPRRHAAAGAALDAARGLEWLFRLHRSRVVCGGATSSTTPLRPRDHPPAPDPWPPVPRRVQPSSCGDPLAGSAASSLDDPATAIPSPDDAPVPDAAHRALEVHVEAGVDQSGQPVHDDPADAPRPPVQAGRARPARRAEHRDPDATWTRIQSQRASGRRRARGARGGRCAAPGASRRR